MNWLIETEDLGKRYGDIRAVEHLSIRVVEGEIYAFLGLNGAGKTTTIRMLLGMIRPTSGYAMVLHNRVQLGSTEPWKSVGYLVEEPRAYQELTVRENLEVAHKLHPGTPVARIDQVIDQLGLVAYRDRRAGILSHGNAQRLGIAKALLHEPRLLILDEPANGLDPAGIVEIRELMTRLVHESGVTVFMSSHILAEVSKLAQRIGIIHQGSLLQELSIEELEQNRARRLLIGVREAEPAQKILLAAGYATEILQDGSLELKSLPAIERPDDVNLLLVNSGMPPTRLVVEEEELEQYFLRLIGTHTGP